MRKISVLLLIVFCSLNTYVRADEGMWLLSLIGKNYEQMKAQGFRLTPEDIYNVNKSSLKDAVVGLGNANSPFWHFCTGELISGEGLFSTNHHCGFGMIQSHSSVENDYLRDGFWAYKKSDELPNEGISAQILVRMEDVTSYIMPNLNDNMTEEERTNAIDSIGRILSDRAVEGSDNDAQVVDVFNGNQFLLFVYTTYRDVRMVGAPPQSMGKFGGDTDNWEWPRHTADFALFRIYTGKDGKPADYAKDNVPLQSKHFFPISLKGLKDGDFAMIMGFPGSTDRFLTSFGLKEAIQQNDLIHNVRTVKINVLRKKMAESQKTRIQYASKYASCSNYWKYALQQNKALNKLNTMQQKVDIENNYKRWAAGQTDAKYGKALDMIKEGYAEGNEARMARLYISEGVLRGPDLFGFSLGIYNRLTAIIAMPNTDEKKSATDKLMKSVSDFYKDFNPEVEQLLISQMFDYTYKNMDKKYYPSFFNDILAKKYKGNADKYADFIMKKSVFASKEKLESVIGQYKITDLKNDPAVVIANSAFDKIYEIRNETKDAGIKIEKGDRYFVDGLLQINKDKKLMAPNANSTIRLTYGNIGGYHPKDGVYYNYYTTLKGVMEKEAPTSSEFMVAQKLKDLFEAKDYGIYADKNGDLPVCFISNNDITGGNSGSPVLDAEGNLIGLAFDGNSEAMSGDIDFEENLQRCINLDVRYMLFIIDKFAGAQNLIDEMKIVK
ncbi:peptidase S46 [Porphyromonadaceae bacterium COT-184 OH4590]|nr:peptidase S46 [Porphyromonadaceae bacterium COT-184 OH4590]